MKKHKIEIAALTLLLGVLCYAYYDCNINISEQDIVLNNELLMMSEVSNKEDITMEMLALDNKKLDLENQNEQEEDKKDIDIESKDENIINDVSLAVENSSIPYNEIISNQVINYALNFVGGPYVYGGNSLTSGTDCSGFTKLVYQNYGINLPRSAPEQAYAGVHIDLENIMPGDIVVSGYDGVVCHASIYIGNNKLVHALNSNVGIVVTSLDIMPIIDVRRVI